MDENNYLKIEKNLSKVYMARTGLTARKQLMKRQKPMERQEYTIFRQGQLYTTNLVDVLLDLDASREQTNAKSSPGAQVSQSKETWRESTSYTFNTGHSDAIHSGRTNGH